MTKKTAKITKYTEIHPAFSKIVTEDINPFMTDVNRSDVFTMAMVLCDIQMQLSAHAMNRDNAPFSEYDVDDYVIRTQLMPSPECIQLTQKMVDCVLSCASAELQNKVAYMFYVVISAHI